MTTKAIVKYTALFASLTLLLSGCVYDYLQHSDRVSYSSGDAVKANLESETTNPSSDAQYKTTGLGKNGHVTAPAAQPP
jgi:hypothetical protein